MSVDLDYFYGSSPPVMSNSPVYSSLINNYGVLNTARYYSKPRTTRANMKALKFGFPQDSIPKFGTTVKAVGRRKKRVKFADDEGFQLTHIKVIYESYDSPPRWSPQFLEQVTRGATAEVSPTSWEILFPQPIADYAMFRRLLDQQKVCLENLIVDENSKMVKGLLKVQNLAFEKVVTVRCTFDNWKTFEDTYCTFVKSEICSLDVFSFDILIPPNRRIDKIEFCLHYSCSVGDFWDSNGGENYVLRANRPEKHNPRPEIKKITPVIGKKGAGYLITLAPHSDCTLASGKSPYW